MPENFAPLVVYLDANVLFSASHKEHNRFLEFWQLENITPATSDYAIGEVRRNIPAAAQHDRLDTLLKKTMRVSDALTEIIPDNIQLVAKDKPILAAAIFASVDYLVTGDNKHFGLLQGTVVSHVAILAPNDFLDKFAFRLR